MAVAYRRDHKVPDRSIGRRQCLRDTASVRAVGDIQFCGDFLVRQLNQVIATWWLTQNGLQFLPVVSAIAKLQLIHRPLLVVPPITCR